MLDFLADWWEWISSFHVLHQKDSVSLFINTLDFAHENLEFLDANLRLFGGNFDVEMTLAHDLLVIQLQLLARRILTLCLNLTVQFKNDTNDWLHSLPVINIDLQLQRRILHRHINRHCRHYSAVSFLFAEGAFEGAFGLFDELGSDVGLTGSYEDWLGPLLEQGGIRDTDGR